MVKNGTKIDPKIGQKWSKIEQKLIKKLVKNGTKIDKKIGQKWNKN